MDGAAPWRHVDDACPTPEAGMADSGAELFAPHRVRVPLAGMPAFSGVRNSGNVAPKPWEDTDLPPSEWRLPHATFTDPARYAEFARFILGLRVIR